MCVIVLTITRRQASQAEVERLPASARGGIVEVIQRIEVAGKVVGIESSALPAELLPRLETQMRYGQHLYPVLADYGLIVTRVEDTVWIDGAEPDAAVQLAVASQAPLLSAGRCAFVIDGQAVELRLGRYLPEQIRYAA